MQFDLLVEWPQPEKPLGPTPTYQKANTPNLELPESPARDSGTRIHSPASEPSSETPCVHQSEDLEYLLSYQEYNTTLGQLGH